MSFLARAFDAILFLFRSKILLQKLQEIESGFDKETVKLFDITNSSNGATASSSSSVSPSNILSANLALLSRPSSAEATSASAHKLINLVHFGHHAPSCGNSSLTTAPSDTTATVADSIVKLQNLKNMLDVLTKLNKSINVFVGDMALSGFDADQSTSEAAKYENLFSSMNIHACMNGVNDLYKSYCIDKTLASHIEAEQEKSGQATGSPASSPTLSSPSISLDMRNLMLNRKMNTVYLCSNIYERVRQSPSTALDGGHSELLVNSKFSSPLESNFKSFGFGNHSTMILECNSVKIGFMALVDESVCRKLLKKVYSKKPCRHESGQCDNDDDVDGEERYYRDLLRSKIEYSDYLNEAKRLSEQLRLCGANLIVALANMDKEDDLNRLVNEASDVDLVLSNTDDQSRPTELKYSKISLNDQDRWVIKGAASFDCLSLISLKVDLKNANKIVDIAITKYNSN